jgi:hypothetical protein
MVPAFADVGAVGALADGVEVQVAGQLLEGVKIIADGCACLEPVWLRGGLARGQVDLDQIRGKLAGDG